MPAATTYYDVVTRYRVDDHATPGLDRYGRSMAKATRANQGFQRSGRTLSRTLGYTAAALAPVVGGLVGIAAFGYGAYKAFENLNTELNATIQLGAQLNLAFKFDDDPAKNFVGAMRFGRTVFRDLVKDAAALPGEMSDFLGIMTSISGPVFAAGATPNEMRELIAKIALATPAAGGSFSQSGLAASMMLSGAARQTSPLTRFMVMSGLLKRESGEKLNVSTWNALMKSDAREGLQVFTRGLSKFVDDPAYRKAILGTFETQLGTLSELLFGSTGITGQLFGDQFDGFIEGMIEFNATIVEYTPSIVTGLNEMGLSIQGLWEIVNIIPWGSLATPFLGWKDMFQDTARFWGKQGRKLTALKAFKATSEYNPGYYLPGVTEANNRAFDRFYGKVLRGEEFDTVIAPQLFGVSDADMARYRANAIGELSQPRKDLAEAQSKNTAAAGDISQTFNIKLDLTSDESPEAIAVKIAKAVETVGNATTTTNRVLSMVPSPSAVSP